MRVLKSATLLTIIGIALWTSSRDASTQSTPSYGVSDLGTIGGATSVALFVDSGGSYTVYGYGATASGDTHAFLGFNGATLDDLGTLGGRSSEARGGWFGNPVGRAQVSSGAYHAFRRVFSSGAYTLQ